MAKESSEPSHVQLRSPVAEGKKLAGNNVGERKGPESKDNLI